MLHNLIKGLRAGVSLSVGVALLATSLAAGAAAFRARFDPIFNTTFSGTYGVNLWWQGSATISVDDACIASLSLPATASFPACGTATLDAYVIDFYNGDPGLGGTLLSPSAIGAGPPGPSAVAFDASGKAIDMDLGPIDLGLFTFGTSNLFAASLSFAIGAPAGSGGPTLAIAPCSGEIEPICSEPYLSEVAPDVTWERVPEPASLALVGLALTVVWLTRRRVA